MTTYPSTYFLGIEGGATRTSVILINEQESVIEQFTLGPANLRLMTSSDLELHLQSIRDRLPVTPCSVGIGLAGARLKEDHDVLRSTVARIWPHALCAPSDDLLTALESVPWDRSCSSQILVLSGTGSCCLGRNRAGKEVKIGGRGHILGDRASACYIAQHALRHLMTLWDSENKWPDLGADILNFLQLKDPEALIDWSLVASKTELASLALVVFEAFKSRQDPISLAVLNRSVSVLSEDALNTAKRLEIDNEDPVQFVLNGAVLTRNRQFREQLYEHLLAHYPNALFTALQQSSAWGACRMAMSEWNQKGAKHPITQPLPQTSKKHSLWRPKEPSPTELRNPLSMDLSEMSLKDSIVLMNAEDTTIPQAVLKEKESIQWTIERVIAAFQQGGRLFYTGAGTSGRLGVLDASECPPTFRVSPSQVQGIIAGGRTALWAASEGIEDDQSAGEAAIKHRNISSKDVVIGISASGYAPFIWGCLSEAKARGATVILLTCHPGYKNHPLPHQVIAPNTGPEILTGSTRLKAGTATKLILNMITTLAMTHTGKVMSNLMTNLNPANNKLRNRAIQIVCELEQVDEHTARNALRTSDWNVRTAIKTLNKE